MCLRADARLAAARASSTGNDEAQVHSTGCGRIYNECAIKLQRSLFVSCGGRLALLQAVIIQGEAPIVNGGCVVVVLWQKSAKFSFVSNLST